MIRENRYVVIKLKDLDKLKQTTNIRCELFALEELTSMLPERSYVVVESDWPEYEKVWKMIEDRVDKELA